MNRPVVLTTNGGKTHERIVPSMSDTITLYEFDRKRIGEFRQIRWCETHDRPPVFYDELAGAICSHYSTDCHIVDKWLEA